MTVSKPETAVIASDRKVYNLGTEARDHVAERALDPTPRNEFLGFICLTF